MHRLILLPALVALVGCGGPDEGLLCVACADFEDPPWCADIDPAPFPDCDNAPGLCHLAVEHWPEQAADAIHIVFVGDGFDVDEAAIYRRAVDLLVAGLRGDPGGIVGRAPGRFAFHRVDLFDGGALPDGWRTPLGTCRAPRPGGASLRQDDDRAELAASAAGPADVVVTLSDSARFRASAGQSYGGRAAIVRLALEHDHRVLDHELGHALVGLGDEYAADDRHYTAPPQPIFATGPAIELGQTRDTPNLSVHGDGRRWAVLVDGAWPGGLADYATGVYHPTDRCRMNDEADPYCPVCDDAIDRWLVRHGHGPAPACAIVAAHDGDDPRLLFDAGPPPLWMGRVEAEIRAGYAVRWTAYRRGDRGVRGRLATSIDELGSLPRVHARCTDHLGQITRRALDVSQADDGAPRFAVVPDAAICAADALSADGPDRWSARIEGPHPPVRIAGPCGAGYRALYTFDAPAAGRYGVTAVARGGAAPDVLLRGDCGVYGPPDEGVLGCAAAEGSALVHEDVWLEAGDPLFIWLAPRDAGPVELTVVGPR